MQSSYKRSKCSLPCEDNAATPCKYHRRLYTSKWSLMSGDLVFVSLLEWRRENAFAFGIITAFLFHNSRSRFSSSILFHNSRSEIFAITFCWRRNLLFLIYKFRPMKLSITYLPFAVHSLMELHKSHVMNKNARRRMADAIEKTKKETEALKMERGEKFSVSATLRCRSNCRGIYLRSKANQHFCMP